jgi:hypothetical protein
LVQAAIGGKEDKYSQCNQLRSITYIRNISSVFYEEQHEGFETVKDHG